MSYPINKSNGDPLVTLEDGQLNTDTSVGLVGRNYVGYGEIQNENFLHLLENFASSGPPTKPISGQLWFNTSQKILNIYDGSVKSWNPVGGSATVAQASPNTPSAGQLWYNSKNNQLNVYTGSSWVVVGPEAIADFGETKAKASVLLDTTNTKRPVVLLVVNNKVIAVIATDTFRINSSNSINGFESIVPGINISTTVEFNGTLNGTADYANRLTRAARINNVGFDGAADITVKASTSKSLKIGNYLLGSDFDGSAEVTLAVKAGTANTPNTLVARDASGNFVANEITATLKGQVNAPSGTSTFDNITFNSITGNGVIQGTTSSASRLNPGARINGVLFDGSADKLIPADANTLTGTNINATVVDSSLRTVGVLQSLNVGDATRKLTVNLVSNVPTISASTGKLTITAGSTGSALTFLDSAQSTAAGLSKVSIIPSADTNLGSSTNKFNEIHATEFKGVATSAYYADLAECYVSDEDYKAGTVVQFGGDYEVTIARNKTSKVAGVVSTNPAYLMNSLQEGEHVVAVALQGKVPCRVAGYVSKGDMMVSGGQGYAMSCDNPTIGTVIGKALEDFHGEFGVINIVVGRV
jgi:hypothetical protein